LPLEEIIRGVLRKV